MNAALHYLLVAYFIAEILELDFFSDGFNMTVFFHVWGYHFCVSLLGSWEHILIITCFITSSFYTFIGVSINVYEEPCYIFMFNYYFDQWLDTYALQSKLSLKKSKQVFTL